jgi:DNA primase
LARTSGGRNDDVAQIIERADIVNVAQRLGLQLDKRPTRPRLALCPFHTDHSPSLHLYQAAPGRDHFHCFVCGAHGDAVTLTSSGRTSTLRLDW